MKHLLWILIIGIIVISFDSVRARMNADELQEQLIQCKDNAINKANYLSKETRECKINADKCQMRFDACREVLNDHSCGHGFGRFAEKHIEMEITHKVQEALRIKDNARRSQK